MAMTVIFKQRVAAAHCSDEQILVAIVVGIGKGGCNADQAGSATPASEVMFLNLPPPMFFHSSLPPTWLTK